MNASNATSLQKVIFRVMFIIVGIVVLLLGLLDGYMIRNYQETTRAEWRNTLNRYAEDVKNDLDDINSDLYDINYYDTNFQMLSTQHGVEALPYVYELDERLKTQMLLKGKATGYVLFYDNLKSRHYFFRYESLPNIEIEELKNAAEKLSGTGSSRRGWLYTEANGKGYALGMYCGNGTSLCVCYCLEDSRSAMQDELKEINAEVFYEYEGEILGGSRDSAGAPEAVIYSDEVVNGSWYYGRQIRRDGLNLHMSVPMNLLSYLNLPQILIMVIAVFGIVITVLFYRRLKRELFSPMDTLITDMKRIGGGDWSGGIHSQSRFIEVQQVIETTDRMIEEIETQKVLNYEKTIQEQQARMQYLSLQLNPHFYLNGLKTLNFLAMKGEDERIQEIIIVLSGYLRYLLQQENEMVTVKEEIAFVKNYVDLYREMLDRKINVDWNIQEETEECFIPRLGIQTFVENSFKYAKLVSKEASLSLGISTGRFQADEGDFLEIMVRDNGEGYDEKLLPVLNDPPAEGSASVGINNLKRRCMFLYDKEVQYAFYNENGAVSDIFLPWTQHV